eukprot:CAMPEP_0203927302 /NCGR_PEP_ID=MMETSP0359-20131031/66729_1 /ASSEMBLY_ACC=CAM_ASM_000338 /TAXON_ID=268821 /ORGANISM="Scrippsiella Hangoei, Strain SHTV-5" /LENGTH=345 /DNA_ID=CAMNT_0050856039 /DNA_START=42 /DNA_END=1079 /DNA_ORIENTATION=-
MTSSASAGDSAPEPVVGECRLCLDSVLDDAKTEEEGRLTFPCSCSAPVHIGCLVRWQEAQGERAVEEQRSIDEYVARASTCEVCGARLVTDGVRPRPLATSAICRAHGGIGKVALRRVPTVSRASRNFSEFAAVEGQELEIIEQDTSGEFYRVRALKAQRYREEGTVSVAEGWIRHIYLEWPKEVAATASMPAPRMPAAFDASGRGPGLEEDDEVGEEWEEGEEEEAEVHDLELEAETQPDVEVEAENVVEVRAENVVEEEAEDDVEEDTEGQEEEETDKEESEEEAEEAEQEGAGATRQAAEPPEGENGRTSRQVRARASGVFSAPPRVPQAASLPTSEGEVRT